MAVFVKRTTKPEKGNKYYIRKTNGGWSPCIQGSPKDPDCDVLSNCVGYAIGRFNEIGGWGSCKYLVSVNAENFIQYGTNGLEVGQTPRLGACMVWQKGPTLDGADGAGHVAIVEQVISDTEVMTSESAYGGKAFYTSTRKKGSDGKWGMGGDYKFLGFVYNPASCCQDGSSSTAAKSESSNVIYKSLGTAAKRKKADISGEPSGRCVKGGYYAASQLITPAAGAQQWFRHAGTDLYSALTDTPVGGNAKLFEQYGSYTVGNTTDTVNVRTAAGTDKPIIKAITKGTQVYLTGKTAQASSMTWAEVVYDGELAWMAKQYIK